MARGESRKRKPGTPDYRKRFWAAVTAIVVAAGSIGVSHAGDLGKHLTADLDDRGIDSSETHSNSLLALLKTNGLHPAADSVLPRRAGALQGTLVTHCCKQRCARDDPLSF